MVCPMKKYEIKFGIVSQSVVPIEPRVEYAVPPKLGSDVDGAHNRKKDD